MAQKDRDITILVVDDEEDFTGMLKDIFSLRGYNVLTAHNGEEALEVVKQKSPNLIILDISMPKMGGIAFYDKVSLPNGSPMYPIIVCTANESYRDLFMDLGVDAFITKPFDVESFLETVEDVIKKRDPKNLRKKAAVEEKKPQRKIMIVEDDAKVRESLAVLFLNAGYYVSTANDGDEAILRIFPEMPHLVLIKQGMPGCPEFVIDTNLKQTPYTRRVDIIVYSGDYHNIDVLTEEKLVHLFGPSHLAAYNDPKALFEKAEMILKKHDL